MENGESQLPRKISALNEPRMELLRLVAYLHVRYGNPRSALSYLRVLARMNPLDPGGKRSLALACLRCGDPEGAALAAAEAESMEDTDRGHSASRLLLGLSRMRQGLHEEARKACDGFLEGRVPAI